MDALIARCVREYPVDRSLQLRLLAGILTDATVAHRNIGRRNSVYILKW